MLSWMSRTALELIGQAGIGHSFDPLVEDVGDEYTTAVKNFLYVLLLCRAARGVILQMAP